ncbi:phosphatidic acid phosphatase (PAP2) family protein [Actinidia rufa]|uniref:Phosphatidic acid phosphatase (PAP2) family protein n=1 Tax=Actinidia rufa TaxID=165716 RepID=A0A7J0GKU8_9ERIC|nr:phosphatidic acid phosphatase (PAP2) family protein [Actinidia rufa]
MTHPPLNSVTDPRTLPKGRPIKPSPGLGFSGPRLHQPRRLRLSLHCSWYLLRSRPLNLASRHQDIGPTSPPRDVRALEPLAVHVFLHAPDLFQNRFFGSEPAVGFGAPGLAAHTMYSRVYLGYHTVAQVFAGAALGLVLGRLVLGGEFYTQMLLSGD